MIANLNARDYNLLCFGEGENRRDRNTTAQDAQTGVRPQIGVNFPPLLMSNEVELRGGINEYEGCLAPKEAESIIMISTVKRCRLSLDVYMYC